MQRSFQVGPESLLLLSRFDSFSRAGGVSGTAFLPAEAPAEEDEPALASPERDLDWIFVEVKDPDGNPVGSERYRMELPDGTTREGRLGAGGSIRVHDIPVGSVMLTFPDLDESEVEAA